MSRRKFRVSVIMACHNSAPFLNEAIKSVLQQTISDLELILIDDGSTDDTFKIAEHYKASDDRITILSLPEKSGPAAARNAGLQIARGEWAAILDSDDIAMPSRFEEQLKAADGDGNLVLIGSNSISIDAQGRSIKTNRYPTRHRSLSKRLERRQAFPPHSSIMYKKGTIDKLTGFNIRFIPSEDRDICLRLSEIGKLASIDKPLVKIRKHERNLSNSEEGRLQIRMGIAAQVCHFFRTRNIPDPSTSDDEAQWHEFLAWLDRQLITDDAYAKRKIWEEARTEYFGAINKPAGIFRFGTRLLQSGKAGVLAWNKLFGSSLPQRLARKWISRS